MTNHPNRGRDSKSGNPTSAEIRAAREGAGLSQTEAAALIDSALRSWQDWESGRRRMHPAFWRLFLIETHVVQPRNHHP